MTSLTAAPALAVLAGGLTFGFAGFAFALFASAGLALAWPLHVVVPAVMLVADTLTLPLLWEHRRSLGRDVFGESPLFAPWSAVLLLVGVAGGAFLLGRVSPAVGRLGLAAVTLGFVAVQGQRSLTRSVTGPPKPPPWAGGVTVLVAGFLDGWISAGGGVVMAVYLTWRHLAKEIFVPALLVYFLATDALRAVTYAVLGLWTTAAIELYVSVLPLAVVGYAVGVGLRRFAVPSRLFRAIVLGLLAIYAVALIARAVTE